MAEPLRADAYSDEQEQDFQASILKRSPEQERARIQRMRMMRGEGNTVPRNLSAANDNSLNEAANDNQSQREPSKVLPTPQNTALRQAEQKVQMLRRRQGEEVSIAAQKSAVNYLGYIPAFAIAIFKDLLDFIGVGSLPVIGLLVTAMASFLIAIALFATDSTLGMQSSRRVLTRVLILLGVTAVEGVAFGLNFFPLETAAVALILLLDLKGGNIQKLIKYTPIGRISKGVIK